MKFIIFSFLLTSMVILTGCGYKADPKYDDSEAKITKNK